MHIQTKCAKLKIFSLFRLKWEKNMSINSWKEQVQLIIKDSREKLQT